ncbi:MAG: hypothetical protein LUQ25_04535 [Methanoregulaceae archaeon]|nr:hypothetical protein [Methanoregulaceae archaeon]
MLIAAVTLLAVCLAATGVQASTGESPAVPGSAGETVQGTAAGEAVVVDALPDLRVWTYTSPSGVVTRTFTILNSVRNSGTGSAGAFYANFYISHDTTITTTDTYIGTRHYSGLAPGAAGENLNTPVSIPFSVPGGTYYLGMIIDPYESIEETDETNNVACNLNAVTINNPDLHPHTFSTPGGAVSRTFTIQSSVENIGTGDAGEFYAGFYISPDTTFSTADTRIGSRYYSGLAPGVAGPNIHTTVTVPSSVPAGTYYTGMIIDPNGHVTETSEGNNIAYNPVAISIADPDLVTYSFSPPSGPVNRTFTIYNSVRNQGTGDAGAFSVGFYLSPDTTITTADPRIGSRHYSGLGAGVAGPNLHTSVTVPSSVPTGTYYVGMIIDPDNAVVEGNENNNVKTDLEPVTIGPPVPNITGITPARGIRGKTIAVTDLAGSDFRATNTIGLKRAGWPDIPMTDVVITPTKISGKFVIPATAHAGLRNVVVTNSGGESGILANGFRVLFQTPVITGVSPNTSNDGTTVSPLKIRGRKFRAGAEVILVRSGETPVPVTITNVTPHKITGTVTLPAGMATGWWKVKVKQQNCVQVVKVNAFKVT